MYFPTLEFHYFHRCTLTLFRSFHFLDYIPRQVPSVQRCACFYKASSLCSLADSPSFHPSSFHLPNSLSSGSIKSLLICSFLLIWIHTGPNCWLGSAKETRPNEVYKAHNWSLCLCEVVFLFMHACLWVLLCTCFFSDCCFNLHLFSFQNIHSVFPLRYTYPFIAFTLSCPHILYFLCAPHLNLFSKPFTPAGTLAPAKGLKATHVITFTVRRQQLSQQHCAEVSGEV